MERIGNTNTRWATHYSGGWTVFDRIKGCLVSDVSRPFAERLIARR